MSSRPDHARIQTCSIDPKPRPSRYPNTSLFHLVCQQQQQTSHPTPPRHINTMCIYYCLSPSSPCSNTFVVIIKPAQLSSHLQMQETTDREAFQLPARFESTQNRPISRTLVFSIQVHPVLTEPVCLVPRSLPDTCASSSFHHHRPTLAQQQPTTITPSNHRTNHHRTVVRLSPFKFTSSTRVNTLVCNDNSSLEVLLLSSTSQRYDISSRSSRRSIYVAFFLSTAPTSSLQWWFM